MFTLETQLRGGVNGVMLGPAKQFAAASSPQTVHNESIVYALACFQEVLYFSEYLKEDDTRISR